MVFRIVRDQFAAHPQLNPDPGSIARMLETWVAPTRRTHRRRAGNCPERVQYALESQTLAAELQMENSLGRSLKFGRVTGSVIVLCRLGTRSPRRKREPSWLAGEGTAIAGRAALGSVRRPVASQPAAPNRLNAPPVYRSVPVHHS